MQGINFSVGDLLSLVTAAGVLIALVSNTMSIRARRRDGDPNIIEMRSDIKYIRTTLDRQEGVAGEQQRRLDDADRRITVIEESVRSAHKRIDEMRKVG